MIALVVAHSANRVIGRDGDLPWRLPGDLRRFKEITLGHTVVMGRATWESLPERFRPLPGRRNVVLSSRPDFAAEGALVCRSLAEALAAAGDDDVYVIGGGITYAEALPLASRVHVTYVDAHVEGDTFFPALPAADWTLAAQEPPVAENGFTYSFRTYDRARLYDLEAARTQDQRSYMEELERDRICIFCDDERRGPVVLSGEHWYVKRNDFPYAGTVAHYLIVPHAHVTSFDELPDEAGAELWAIKRTLKDRHAPLATATVERSGDMRFNGGSVAHLHTHFVALGDAPAKTVRFRVSAYGAGEG